MMDYDKPLAEQLLAEQLLAVQSTAVRLELALRAEHGLRGQDQTQRTLHQIRWTMRTAPALL